MSAEAQMPGESGRSLLDLAQYEFSICNACRYCEGYCAVFPAMERRSFFTEGDLGYIASVCHDCRACTQACMYAEPHEFEINIPKLLAEARTHSWERKAWPTWLASAFESGPLTLLALNVVVFLLLLAGTEAFGTLTPLLGVKTGPGAFYKVVSHLAMMVPALLLTAYGVFVLGVGVVSFWRDAGGRGSEMLSPRLWARALWESATLAWMRGGGGECYYPDKERPSSIRRHLHAATMYGFIFAFLSTTSAFFEEYAFGVLPPYPPLSVPVMFGMIGGAGLIVGLVGLLWLKRTNSRDQTTGQAMRMDVVFMASLLAVSVTGVLLLVLRDTGLMRILLVIHLATVFAFYLTVPYGKFVHVVYRIAAVLRSVQERAEPETSQPAP